MSTYMLQATLRLTSFELFTLQLGLSYAQQIAKIIFLRHQFTSSDSKKLYSQAQGSILSGISLAGHLFYQNTSEAAIIQQAIGGDVKTLIRVEDGSHDFPNIRQFEPKWSPLPIKILAGQAHAEYSKYDGPPNCSDINFTRLVNIYAQMLAKMK